VPTDGLSLRRALDRVSAVPSVPERVPVTIGAPR